MFGFLVTTVAISLSGVMAPGPITAATLAAGTRSRHAGVLIALGHLVVELPLILLLVAGIGKFLQASGTRVGIGLAGGAFLLLASQAMEFGLLVLGLFALVHWLCDLIWLEVLSLVGFKGTEAFCQRSQKIVSAVCGVLLLGFGLKFV